MAIGRALGFILALTLAVPLAASADPPDRPEHKHDAAGPRLYLVLRMADELNLSDEKALAVSRILKEGDDKRETLRKKRAELEDKIRDALAQSKPDAAALGKLVDQATEMHKEQGRIADESFTALKKVLTVQEQAKLVLLRSRLHHDFRFHMRPPDGPMGEGRRHHGHDRGLGDSGPGPGPGPGPEHGPPDDDPDA